MYHVETVIYVKVVPTRIVHDGNEPLTYQHSQPVPVGSVVTIPVGKTETTGVVWGATSKPAFATRPISEVLYLETISQPLLKVAEWISSYYAVPLAQAMQLLIPTGITRKRREQPLSKLAIEPIKSPAQLTDDQSKALKKLQKYPEQTVLLHGVTGSGKTRLYIERAQAIIAAGKSVIVLVPEIALTSQLVREFSSEFDDLVLSHSGLSESERHRVWENVAAKPRGRVVIGARSALFLPLQDVGLIVVDEAHDDAYHQDQNPKYHAVRVASQYGQLAQAQVILGTATPRVVDYFIAEQKKAPVVKLERPAKTALKRDVLINLVDLREPSALHRGTSFSGELIKQIKTTLAKGEQVLLFHNRRGTATTALCQECGHVFGCPTCGTNLTLHGDFNRLVCHTCGHKEPVPKQCPSCGHHVVLFKGFGTKQIYSDAHQFFPTARIARFDTDTKRDQALHQRYQAIINGEVDIIVGTQMVAKGLDLPHLGLVGIMLADSELRLPDFSASERTFGLIHQVSGRVGRHQRQDQIVIQTFNPEHPAIVTALNHDYQGFYEYEIAERQKHRYPPFTYLANLTCAYARPGSALKAAARLQGELQTKLPSVQILGPAPAFLPKRGEKYRYHLVLKSRTRADLIQALKLVPSNWTSDLDPVNLL